MGNILTYLENYGDIAFRESKFNEVDNLILSQISYIDFDEIVPSIEENKFITVEEAYKVYFSKRLPSDEIKPTLLVLKAMAKGKRFKKATLSKYVNLFDEKQKKQFSALHIELDDETVYIAFRGTDSHLISWHEDFSMSYQITASQREAVLYLQNTIGDSKKIYRVGGHSKAGNLAIFACMWCQDDIKDKIIEIYDNDGPGFNDEILESTEYKKIIPKLKRFVPGYCIFGMLFKHKGIEHTIVSSTGNGIFQHDSMTWEVDGIQFIKKKSLIKQSILISKTINNWIDKVETDKRKTFTNLFFKSLELTGIKNIAEILGNIKIINVIKTMVALDISSILTFAVLIQSFLSIYVIGILQPL